MPTANEYCATALAEAAEALAGANNAPGFLSAIEYNYCLWPFLSEILRPSSEKLDKRILDFITSITYRAGRNISDRDIAVLIKINNDFSSRLVEGCDLTTVRRRVEAAWREAAPDGMGLIPWLISEIDRISRLATARLEQPSLRLPSV